MLVGFIQRFEDNLHESGPDPKSNQSRLLKYKAFMNHNFITTHPSALSFIKDKKAYSYMPIPVDENIERYNVFNLNPRKDLFYAMSHGVNRAILKKGKSDSRIYFLNSLIRNNA